MRIVNFFILILFFISYCPSEASEIISIEIYPRPVEISVGDTVLLRAVGKDAEGKIIELLFPLWSVDNNDLGRFYSINDTIISFTAEKKGKGRIIVKSGNVTGEEEIIIYDTLPPYNDIWPVRKSDKEI